MAIGMFALLSAHAQSNEDNEEFKYDLNYKLENKSNFTITVKFYNIYMKDPGTGMDITLTPGEEAEGRFEGIDYNYFLVFAGGGKVLWGQIGPDSILWNKSGL